MFRAQIDAVWLFCALLLGTLAVADDRETQEERRRLLIDQDQVCQDGRTPGVKLEIGEVEFPRPVNKAKHGFPIPDAKIDQGRFLKDGRASYLLGAEGSINLYPFLYRQLGCDWIQLGGSGCSLELVVKERREGDTFKISFHTPKEMEQGVKEILEGGFLAYVEHMEISAYRRLHPALSENAKDLFTTLGHFYLFRHDHPEAWKIRANSLKSRLAAVGAYPVFAHELFNEVSFMDYGEKALADFRLAMAKRHGTVEAANRKWGTTFERFAAVEPPRVGGGGDASFTILGRDVPRPLWLDWLKFCEKRSAEAFQKSADLVKIYDPSSYTTVQTHCQFFFDYGAHGTNPLLKSQAEDFYGDESSVTYYHQIEGHENAAKINSTLRVLLWLDYLSGILPDKPQVSEETWVGGGFSDFDAMPLVVDMRHDRWKFISDNQELGMNAGYAKPGYDDSAWQNIKVPDMWANHGHANTRFGWYRLCFSVPAEHLGRQLYLNGSQLADQAIVYLNGEELHRTKRWNDTFGLEVGNKLRAGDNVLAISIKNNYFVAGRYWGGIRGNIGIARIDGGKRIPMDYGQVRSFLWERVLHGEAGVFASYFYVPEGYYLSLFNPEKIAFAALKGLPQAKAEIDSMGDLVMGRKPRWKGEIALAYPLETMRAHIHNDFAEMMRGPLLAELVKWYAGALFSGVSLEVLSNDRLASGDIGRFRALLLQGDARVPATLAEKLPGYVDSGGLLVLDAGSLLKDDLTDSPLDTGALLKGGSPLDIQAGGVKVAITIKQVGGGKVYLLPSALSGEVTSELLQAILKREGIEPAIKVALSYAERHLLGGDGRYLLYLHNWGGGEPEAVVTVMDGLDDSGFYQIRDLETGATLIDSASVASLRSTGLKLKLPSQTPVALLLERQGIAPLSIKGLTAEQRQWLDFLARPAPQGVFTRKRILFDAAHLNQYSRVSLLTAAKALEDRGYEVNTALGYLTEDYVKTYTDHIAQEKLFDYGILFFGGPRVMEPKEAAALATWAENGGGLFLCGNWFRGTAGCLSNSGLNAKLYAKFGAAVGNESFSDSVRNTDGDPQHPIFVVLSDQDLTRGVGELHSQGMALLKLKDPAWRVLVKGGKTSSHPGKPALAVREFGKGRVVLCGDPAWIKPAMLDKGDNRGFFLKLMDWLAEGAKAQSAAPPR